MKAFIFMVVSMLLALSVTKASGEEFLVSNRSEFDAALAVVQPGDAIVCKNGNWSDTKLKFQARGQSGKPVTFRAESPGSVVFSGSSELVIDGPHLVVSGFKFQNNSNVTDITTPYNVAVASIVTFTTNASYSRLTETAIFDSGPGVSTFVHLKPGNFSNRVDHCYFSKHGAKGVTFYLEVHPTQPNYHLVDYNYFGDRKPGQGNGWETIRIGHSLQQYFVSGTIVARNYFHRCNGEIECISNKSTGNQYLYNAFVENRGQLTLRHGNRARIEGNYFFAGDDPSSQGVRIIGSDHQVINNYFKGLRDAVIVYSGQINPEPRGYAAVTNVLIAFNTFEDCANNLDLGASGRELPPQKLRIVGNLIKAKPGSSIVRSRAAGIDVAFDGNIMFGAELGIADQTGITRAKPDLLADVWGRLCPAATAPTLVAFENPPPVSKDLNGKSRANNPVAGAVIESAAPLYPLSSRDVGPNWNGN